MNSQILIALLNLAYEQGYINDVFRETVVAQVEAGGIDADIHFHLKHGLMVFYDNSKNKIFLDSAKLYDWFPRRMLDIVATNNLKQLMGFIRKNYFSSDIFRHIVGELFYAGVISYNRHRPNDISQMDEVKKWYINLFEKSIYNSTENLTTVSRLAGNLWGSYYLKLINEFFEEGVYHPSKNIHSAKKKYFAQLDKIDDIVKEEINKHNFDNTTLKRYGNWLDIFKLIFESALKNQRYIIKDKFEQKHINTITSKNKKLFEEIDRTLNESIIQSSYEKIIPSKYTPNRYPYPILRELFLSAEPLAQSMYMSSLTYKKSDTIDPQWMNVASRGISFLG